MATSKTTTKSRSAVKPAPKPASKAAAPKVPAHQHEDLVKKCEALEAKCESLEAKIESLLLQSKDCCPEDCCDGISQAQLDALTRKIGQAFRAIRRPDRVKMPTF